MKNYSILIEKSVKLPSIYITYFVWYNYNNN